MVGGKVNELFNAKDGHYSLRLSSGWTLRTYTDRVKGSSWIEATKSSAKLIRFKQFPTLNAANDMGVQCDALSFSSGYVVKTTPDHVVLALNLDCAAIGGDIMSGDLLFSLISISNEAQPKIKLMWSKRGRRWSNESRGYVEDEHYEVKPKGEALQIWKQTLSCKHPEDADLQVINKARPM